MSQLSTSRFRFIHIIVTYVLTLYRRFKALPDAAYTTMVMYYIVISMVWFWPYLLNDQVVSPRHLWSNGLIAIDDQETPLKQFLRRNSPATSRYSDIIGHTIPETSYLLRGFGETGVVSHWNNLTGLGRQSVNFSANGAMNYVVWFMNLFTDDAYRMITFRNLSLIFLGGLFMMLLLKELRIHPVATLATGVLTLTLPLYAYWSSFLEFYVSMTCSIIIMYGLYRAIHTRSITTWVLIALTCYFMLITGYMQQNLFLAYFLAGVVVIILWQHYTTRALRLRYVVFVATAVGIGGILASPVLIDLVVISQSTTRTLSFGNQTPAQLPNAYDIAQFFLPVSYDITPWSETPNSPHLMFQLLRGRHITLFMGIAIFIGILRKWHRTKGLIAFLCVSFAFSYIPIVHAFGATVFFPTVSGWIKFFDFAPLFIVLLIIAAHGFDALLTQTAQFKRYDIVLPVFVVCLFVLIYMQADQYDLALRWWYLGIELLGVSLMIWALWGQIAGPLKSIGLVGMTCVIGIVVSFPQMVRQPYAEVLPPPTLMIKLQRYVEPDSYLAQYFWRFHPRGNQNVFYDVPTIHIYHNLVSRYYLKFMSDIGGVSDLKTDKKFMSFEGDYHSLSFWLANVSIIIAPKNVPISDLPLIDTDGNVNIYQVENRGFGVQIDTQAYAQHVRYSQKDGQLHADIDDPRTYDYKVPTKYTAMSDLYEVNSFYSVPSLMVFSQVFDARWQADVLINNQWQPAESVVVNDIFQGVRVPAEATRVRMTFLPWSRYMLIGHVIWSILLLIVMRDVVHRISSWIRHDNQVAAHI